MRALAVAVLILGTGMARAQDTVYDLNFQAGGEQVTGTMTLLGGINGPVRSGDVLSYDFGSALGSAVYFNAIDTVSACLQAGCGLMVSGNNLIWNPPYIPQGTENLAGISGITLYDGKAGSGLRGETSSVSLEGPGGGPPGCFSCGGNLFASGNIDPTDQNGGGNFASLSLPFNEILGTAAGSVAAPEIDPSDAAAGLTLLVGLLAMRTGRRGGISRAAGPYPDGCTGANYQRDN